MDSGEAGCDNGAGAGGMPVPEVTKGGILSKDLAPIRILESAGDAERLRKETEKINILADAAGLLMSSETPERVVQIIGERVMRFLSCQVFFNFLIDSTGDRLQLNAYSGIPAEEAAKISTLEFGVAICGCVARDGRRMMASDIQNSSDKATELVRSYGISAYACHPLIAQGKTQGTLSFGTRDRPSFTPEELDLMQAVTALVATAMARKKTEEALQGTTQYLENIFRYATAPIVVWDTQYRIRRFNHAFENLTGMTADAVLGQPLEILFPQSSRQQSMELIRKTSAGVRWESVEIPVRHVSGSDRIVLWNSAHVCDPEGHILSTLAQGQDITERKTAEDTAISTSSLLQAALDSTADGILVVDENRKITSYNKKFCAIWNIPERVLDGAREEIALSFITPLVADIWEFTERRDELYSHPDRESYDMVSLIDGRIFERYSKPQRIGDIVVGRVWSYRDITDRRRAEISLGQSLEKFRIIATSTPDHLIVQDRGLRYTMVINPQMGKSEIEMIGKTDQDLLPKEEAETVTRVKRKVLETGISATSEIAITGKNGEKRFFAGSYVPKRNHAGEIDGLIGYFRDVTETKLANEKILSALGEKEVLIREIHHRVKNNLQIITGLLEMTRTRAEHPETAEVLTDMMLKIKAMAQVHTRMYQNNQSGKIDMGAQIRDMMNDLSGIYGRTGHGICCEVDANEFWLPVEMAIPCALAMNEILSNSFIYAFKGRIQGVIRVMARIKDGRALIVVKDNGGGIPPGIDPNTTASLGWKLIRNLVRQLGGDHTIESGPGGTTVTIDFPVGVL